MGNDGLEEQPDVGRGLGLMDTMMEEAMREAKMEAKMEAEMKSWKGRVLSDLQVNTRRLQ